MHVVPAGQKPVPGEQPEPDEVFDPSKGDFDVTISTGMSYQSQRAQASDFVDTLLGELQNLPIPPQAKATLLAKAITLKDIGPIGDEMAKIIDPQGDGQAIPPQAQQAISQLQQQLEVAHQTGAQIYQKVQELTAEKQGKIVEGQNRLQQIAAQHAADMELEDKKLLTQITVAEINTKAQIVSDRESDRNELTAQLHDQAHDVAMAAQGHQQAQELASQQAAQQSQQIDQQAQNQSQQSAQDAAQTQAAQPEAGE